MDGDNKKETPAGAEVSQGLENKANETLIASMEWATERLTAKGQLSKEEAIIIERVISACVDLIRINSLS